MFEQYILLAFILIPCIIGLADYDCRDSERALFSKPIGIFNAKQYDGIE